MISGVHVLLYSTNPDADRAFFRDVLNFPSIDIGHSWMIFGLPPAEAAVHPADGATSPSPDHHLMQSHVYLMCDDLQEVMATLATHKVACTAVHEERWGRRTTVTLPSGGGIGLYQPSHPTALKLGGR